MKKQENLNKIISNTISTKKKEYALIIGETPSSGARSPKLWNKVYRIQNKKTKMFPADISSKNLKILMNYLKLDDLFIGSAVTTPYKEVILKYIESISLEAKTIESINTIKKN